MATGGCDATYIKTRGLGYGVLSQKLIGSPGRAQERSRRGSSEGIASGKADESLTERIKRGQESTGDAQNDRHRGKQGFREHRVSDTGGRFRNLCEAVSKSGGCSFGIWGRELRNLRT